MRGAAVRFATTVTDLPHAVALSRRRTGPRAISLARSLGMP